MLTHSLLLGVSSICLIILTGTEYGQMSSLRWIFLAELHIFKEMCALFFYYYISILPLNWWKFQISKEIHRVDCYKYPSPMTIDIAFSRLQSTLELNQQCFRSYISACFSLWIFLFPHGQFEIFGPYTQLIVEKILWSVQYHYCLGKIFILSTVLVSGKKIQEILIWGNKNS